MKYLYFETSAIDYLAKTFDDDSIIFLRDYIIALTGGGKLCLSPISLWEIACTGDGETKEKLIRVCQLLFDHFVLFPDPIHILDHYIENGCPIEETQEGFFMEDGTVEKVWREIAPDLMRTISIDGDLREMDKSIKRVSKLIEKLSKNDFVLIDKDEDEYYTAACQLIDAAYSSLKFIAEDKINGIENSNIRLHKFSIMFAYLLLIVGITFGSTRISTFWDKRNVETIDEQISYLFSECEPIVYRGPLVCMAMMAECQTKEKTNRGLYKDCLHAMYMPYCAAFFTKDNHFSALKNEEPIQLWGRINNIEEFCDELFGVILPNYLETIQ